LERTLIWDSNAKNMYVLSELPYSGALLYVISSLELGLAIIVYIDRYIVDFKFTAELSPKTNHWEISSGWVGIWYLRGLAI
jgi:hypothetical protein